MKKFCLVALCLCSFTSFGCKYVNNSCKSDDECCGSSNCQCIPNSEGKNVCQGSGCTGD